MSKKFTQVLDFVRKIAGVPGSGADASTPRTVLVVDDEEPIRRFVARVLRDEGWQAITACDGADAVDAAKKIERLDLLVTDLMMPKMSGDELARQLQSDERDLPVLYLTGYSDRLFADRMQLWENEAFLDKPCSVKGLLEAVALIRRQPLEARAV